MEQDDAVPVRARDHVDDILDEWREAMPDVDVSAQGIVGRVLRLSRYFERDLAETFGTFGIRGGEFDVLATLRRTGAPSGLPASELATRCMLSTAAMTNRLDGLESRGLVRREADAADRRVVRISLTPAGLSLIDEAFPRHAANQRAMVVGLSREERDVLAAVLRRLLSAYEEGGPETPTRSREPRRGETGPAPTRRSRQLSW